MSGLGVNVGVHQGSVLSPTALHYSNGSSDTQCERGSTMGDAIC